MKRIEINDTSLGFPYVLYTPNVVTDNMPVIFFLHGSGERDHGEGLKVADIHGFNKIFGDKDYNFLYVVPQIPKTTFWGAKQETIISFIKGFIKKYRCNEKRVYLTGISMGGCAVWQTAMSEPQLFAGIVPICGIGYAWNSNVLDMPIWMFHGDKDTAISVYHSDEMATYLTKFEKNFKYTRYEGVGHNCWDLAYNEETLNWLLSLSR